MPFNVNYNAGGTIDDVKKIQEVNNVSFIEGIHGFPEFLMPYNVMECLEIPAQDTTFTLEITLPDKPIELISMVVTATGYGEEDCYDMYINDHKAFDHWYLQEVKEGLYIGSASYVYRTGPKTKISVYFFNKSGTRKKLYFGVRGLVPNAEQLEQWRNSNTESNG